MDKREVEIALKTLDEHKAEDIALIDVSASNPFASAVIVATCLNPRALGAMEDLLEDAYESEGIKVVVKEGEPDSGWIILSVSETIIHLLLEGNRRELQIEDLLKRLEEKAKK